MLLRLLAGFMSTLSFHQFLTGRGAYVTGSHWTPVTAVIATVLILLVGQLAPMVLISILTASAPSTPPPTSSSEAEALLSFSERIAPSLLLVAQATLAVLTVFAAGLFGGRAAENLHLVAPRGGIFAFVYALLLMIPVLVVVNAVAYGISPSGFMEDFRQFAGVARSPQPLPQLVAIGVGAPIWEELVFRGFLLAPLAAWIGFWPAAALVSASWTAMHIGYSASGLVEVFVIGLYFAWLLQRTGSLWVPIVCHATYNTALFLVLRQITF